MSSLSPSGKNLPRRLLKIVALLLLFLLLFNGLAYAYLQLYNPNKAYALIQHKWSLLQKSPAVDWLILGDSAGNQGVNPSIFQREKNSSAINACTIADLLLLNNVWQLEMVIKNGNAPKKLLLVHTYDIWQREQIPTGYASQIPVIPTHYALTQYALSPAKKYLMNALPLNFQRTSIAYILQHPTTWFQRKYNWERDGFEPIKMADITEVKRDTEAHLNYVKQNDFKISPANAAALEALAELAKSANIKVHFAQSPYHKALLADEDFTRYLQQVETYLQTFCTKNNWTYLADIQTFAAEEMENADHLTAAAADRFTEGILRQVVD